MEVLTLGSVWLALLIMAALIEQAIKIVAVTMGIVLLVVSVAYGIYDRVKGRSDKKCDIQKDAAEKQ